MPPLSMAVEPFSPGIELQDQEQKGHSEKRPRYRRPRHETSPKIRAAQGIAWAFRQRFHPRSFIPFAGLWKQAFWLFRQGWRPEEIMQAIDESARTRSRRGVPRTLYWLLGWLRSLRQRAVVLAGAARRGLTSRPRFGSPSRHLQEFADDQARSSPMTSIRDVLAGIAGGLPVP